MSAHTISLSAQIEAAERELDYRLRCYPKWVIVGKMQQAKADYEIAAMRAIIATLKSLQPPQPEQHTLL